MTTKLSNDQKREYLSWLRQIPDCIGECDSCHSERKLWCLPIELDDEPEAGWSYCKECFTRIVKRS